MTSKRSDASVASSAQPVIVITGASQGIGAAIARAFAERGPCILALLARSEKNLIEVATACREHPDVRAEVFPCDVTDAEQVGRTVSAVEESAGVVDILVNNAGQFTSVPFLDFSQADFDRQLSVNLRSVFVVSQAFVGGMVRRGSGDIVNICSIAALQAHPGGAGYCAGKAGLLGLNRVMREELKEYGIRVTAVHPGATFTPSWEGAGIPEERMMASVDVARAVVDLTSLSRRTVVEDVILRPLAGDLG